MQIDISWYERSVMKTPKSTAQKIKFPIKDFFSKCDQIRWKMRIWSHLLNKSLMKNFIFCAVEGFITFSEVLQSGISKNWVHSVFFIFWDWAQNWLQATKIIVLYL